MKASPTDWILSLNITGAKINTVGVVKKKWQESASEEVE